MLKDGLEEHHATTARLNETLRMQKAKAAHTYRSYGEREQLFEVIKDRIERWAVYRQRKQEQQDIEGRKLLVAIEMRTKRSAYQHACKQEQKLYAPQVLARAREILTERYADEKSGTEIIQQSIRTIAKSMS